MYGEAHMRNSTEVFFIDADRRLIVYGKTREQVIEQLDEAGFRMDDIVVTKTRVVQRGLPRQWVRVPRRFDEYGERVS